MWLWQIWHYLLSKTKTYQPTNRLLFESLSFAALKKNVMTRKIARKWTEGAMKDSFQLGQAYWSLWMKSLQFFFLSVSVTAAGLAGGMSLMDKLLSWRATEKQGVILNCWFSLSLSLTKLMLFCICSLLPTCTVCVQEVNEITITLKIKYKSECLQEQEGALRISVFLCHRLNFI